MICEGLGCREGEKPLKDLKVAVDAGNGAGGFYATDVLAPLGADVSASQYLEPDGNFPNHAPNPEDAEAAGSLSRRVLECGADLGIIFDTDVDRVGAAGSDGKSIARNRMIALGAFISGKGGAIVTDSVTSTQLAHFLKSKGYEHLRYKRGYKNVINKGLELNGEGVYCPLAAETSGHAALRENYFLDDGAYLAAKIVIRAAMLKAAGGHIEDLISDLKEPLEAAEYRLAVTDGDFAACSAAAIEELRSWVGQGECGADNPCGGRCRCGMSLDEPNYEWVRVNCDRDNGDGWFLLRQSLHEPVMPLNIESNSPGGVALIASKVAKLLEKHKGIDISSIKF